MAGIIHKEDIRHPAHPQYAGIKKETAPAEKERAETEKESKIPSRKETK